MVDLTGQRFGKLIALEPTNKRNTSGSIIWKCKCECGGIKETASQDLKSGHTTTCGCGRTIDLSGQRFGRLTALYSTSGPSGRLWYCKCDCGKMKEKPLSSYELKNGKRNHCGCIKQENGMHKHGQSDTKLYKVWSAMKHRCDNPNSTWYHNYGGRGISYFSEWKEFMPFYEWANSSGYGDGLTLERIDADGDYKPSNCTWIPKSEQTNNRRINKNITYKGKTQNMKEWAKELGFEYYIVQSRITKLGWSVEKAFETPVNKPKKIQFQE